MQYPEDSLDSIYNNTQGHDFTTKRKSAEGKGIWSKIQQTRNKIKSYSSAATWIHLIHPGTRSHNTCGELYTRV